ncbi:MAG: ABC transporter permease subunit [bacterium]
MILTLFKYDIKQNWGVWTIVLAVLLLYFTVILGMYDPVSNQTLIDLAAMKMSPEWLQAFGFEVQVTSSLIDFISSFFYGMLMILFPLIYLIIGANRVVVQHIDRGSMAFLLTAPFTRTKILRTQIIFLVGSLFDLFFTFTVIAVLLAHFQFPGMLDYGQFIYLNLGVFLLYFLLSSIAILGSVIFNQSRHAMAVIAGVPVLMYIMQMIANANPTYEWTKYLSCFTLFDNTAIASGELTIINYLAMFVLSVVIYFVAFTIFKRRDISV